MAKNSQPDNKKAGKKKTKEQDGPLRVDVQSSNPKDSKQSVLVDDA